MTDKAIRPWRRRMIKDMTVGGLVPKTQTEYIRVIEVLLGHKKLDSSARTTLHAVKSPLGHLSPRRLPPD